MRRRAKRRRARATPRVVALLCAALASTPAVARARAMRRDSPRTWDDVARDALETCAPTRDRATCVAAALLANCADGARDAAAATCAARATTTRALDAPSEDARGARRTLLANCAAVGRALGRDRAYDETAADGGARACGTAADATCDGGCVEGVLERVAERAASDDANASAEALVGKVLRTCDAGEGGTYETCARAVGWATARARANERATREVWEACAGAKGANGARACRFGVVEAYVDAGLARGVRDAAEACESSDFVGAGGGRARDRGVRSSARRGVDVEIRTRRREESRRVRFERERSRQEGVRGGRGRGKDAKRHRRLGDFGVLLERAADAARAGESGGGSVAAAAAAARRSRSSRASQGGVEKTRDGSRRLALVGVLHHSSLVHSRRHRVLMVARWRHVRIGSSRGALLSSSSHGVGIALAM